MSASKSGLTAQWSSEPSDKRTYQQLPSIDEDKKQQLEWQRNHNRREHHHAHGEQYARNNHINNQKWEKNKEPYFKCLLKLTDSKGRDDHTQRQIHRFRRVLQFGHPEEKSKLFLLCLFKHK